LLLEIIADAGFGHNVFGVSGVRLYFLAQMGNIDAHVIQVIGIFPAPNLFQKLLVSEDTPSVCQKN